MEHEAFHKVKYVMVFVDEASRYTVVQPLKNKTAACLKGATTAAFTAFAEAPGKAIVVDKGSLVHSDADPVLMSAAYREFLLKRGVQQRTSPPYTHERNGIVERAIQTLSGMARGLVQQAGLDMRYWFLAYQHAAFVRNRSPTSAFGGDSPLFVLTGQHPPIDKLRRFGCTVHVKIDEGPRHGVVCMLDTMTCLTVFVWCLWMTRAVR
eukprot:m.210806 g.210806  ORF g.210806 m.210806 type:complete len:208 (+) comp15559_c1_seq1:2011-2634(+)